MCHVCHVCYECYVCHVCHVCHLCHVCHVCHVCLCVMCVMCYTMGIMCVMCVICVMCVMGVMSHVCHVSNVCHVSGGGPAVHQHPGAAVLQCPGHRPSGGSPGALLQAAAPCVPDPGVHQAQGDHGPSAQGGVWTLRPQRRGPREVNQLWGQEHGLLHLQELHPGQEAGAGGWLL